MTVSVIRDGMAVRLRQISVAMVGASIFMGVGLVSTKVSADVSFVFQTIDPDGAGFNDTTPASPIGGNTGTTLGEQRRIAFQHAMDIYAKTIFSDVPIVVQASFADLLCDNDTGAVLGSTNPTTAVSNVTGDGVDPNVVYPIALANHLVGIDLQTDQPDITMELNANVDSSDCLGGYGWYYGIDETGPQEVLQTDLMRVVLHELAHGLGFTDFVDRDTGAGVFDKPDVFSLHVWDNSTGKRWSDMTNAERLASLTHVRNVVWDGKYVTALAPDYLVLGSPLIEITPQLSGFSGIISEAGFGPYLADKDVEADLVVGSPIDGCSRLQDVSGKVPLLYADSCPYEVMAGSAQSAGAVGVIVAAKELTDSPPPHLMYYSYIHGIDIPAVSVTIADADMLKAELKNGGHITVKLTSDPDVRVGADANGRVYLFATNPAITDSMSHWDFLARNNLLLEPQETVSGDVSDIDLTPALLRDIGWNMSCGNGELNSGEECDDGPTNSDTEPNACRTTCKSHYCGDSVVDSDEACDNGPDNSDTKPDHCRTDCTNPRCGDAVVDATEACDSGDKNSDSIPDACRLDCTKPRCGDGVVDSNEECDPGSAASSNCNSSCLLTSDGGTGADASSQTRPTPDAGTQGKSPTDANIQDAPTRDQQPDQQALLPSSDSEKNEPKQDGCGCRAAGQTRYGGTELFAILGFLSYVFTRKRKSSF
jgi:hypothetical protein